MGVGNIANSSMQAAMRNMEVISNNIANVNTPGFKRSSLNFSELYAGNVSDNRQPGLGVRIDSLRQNFSTGRLDSTNSQLDMSLNNDAFFIQRDPFNGTTHYTRAGHFNMDNDGYIYGFSGHVQGFPAKDGVILGSANLVDLQIPNSPLPAKATEKTQIKLNLNAADEVKALPFDVSEPNSYNYRSDLTVFDSLGNEGSLSVYYIKQADNTWTAQLLMNGQNIGTGSLTFNGSNGALAAATGFDALSWNPTGGATSPQAFSMDLTGSTQSVMDSREYSKDQNGYGAGVPQEFNIDDSGKLNVYYSNGESRFAGQVALARFTAPQGLAKADNMSWLATPDSGDPIINSDNSEGNISIGTLELSNVDITEELVKLMGAQHDFQASAQIQQTYNQVLQTIEKL